MYLTQNFFNCIFIFIFYTTREFFIYLQYFETFSLYNTNIIDLSPKPAKFQENQYFILRSNNVLRPNVTLNHPKKWMIVVLGIWQIWSWATEMRNVNLKELGLEQPTHRDSILLVLFLKFEFTSLLSHL